MATIIKLKPGAIKKFDFKAVKKSKHVDLEHHGQLNMFSSPEKKQGRIVQMQSNDLSPFEQALLMDDKGELSAKEVYLRAIEQDDYVADAYCNLGIIESKEGNVAKAVDCFTYSLKYEPRHFESHFNLGNLYLDEENLRLSRLHYQIAIEIQPDYPNVYFNLALAHAMMGELRESIHCLKRFKTLTNVSEHKNADELLRNLQLTVNVKAGTNQ